jgi:carbamoyl-phosphate synthase large subunit
MDAFRKAIADLGMKGKLIAADISAASPSCHVADASEIVPRAGCIEYIPGLLDIVKRHNVSLVLPMTDLDIRSLARQRAKFDAVGCSVMIGSEESIKLCRDKAAFQKVLASAGLATIKTMNLAEFRTNPFYPCFVKPLRGSASVGAGVIKNDGELKAHVATFGELLVVQEHVPGQEFTVDVFRSRNGTIHCIVPRLRMVIRSGEVEKGITIRDKRVIEDTRKLAGLLDDVWGVFCCQCKRKPGGPPRFFEVNPRFGGGSPLSIAAGANLPRYVLQEILGKPIDKDIDFQENLMMLRYDQAVFTVEKKPESLPGFDEPISK